MVDLSDPFFAGTCSAMGDEEEQTAGIAADGAGSFPLTTGVGAGSSPTRDQQVRHRVDTCPELGFGGHARHPDPMRTAQPTQEEVAAARGNAELEWDLVCRVMGGRDGALGVVEHGKV